MGDGVSHEKTLALMAMPLSEQEEAILELMKRISRLEHENYNLKEEVKRLHWSIQEHDFTYVWNDQACWEVAVLL